MLKKLSLIAIFILIFSNALAEVIVRMPPPIQTDKSSPPMPANDSAANPTVPPEKTPTSGAAALMFICINSPRSFDPPIQFDFTVKTKKCMDTDGENAALTISQAGLNCVLIGKIEAHSKGFRCAGGKSRWEIRYTSKYVNNAVVAPYSGATSSRWVALHSGAGNAAVHLINQSPNTVICPTELLCKDTSQEWVGIKNLYLIFTPNSK